MKDTLMAWTRLCGSGEVTFDTEETLVQYAGGSARKGVTLYKLGTMGSGSLLAQLSCIDGKWLVEVAGYDPEELDHEERELAVESFAAMVTKRDEAAKEFAVREVKDILSRH